jgi:hypothetical protein
MAINQPDDPQRPAEDRGERNREQQRRTGRHEVGKAHDRDAEAAAERAVGDDHDAEYRDTVSQQQAKRIGHDQIGGSRGRVASASARARS